MSGRDEGASTVSTGTTFAATDLLPMGVERSGDAARLEEPPRKRLKLQSDEAGALRKRILEYKLLRLKTLRDRFTEQLSELYFLQAGGNMMDYASWRKRPPAPALQAFLEARRPPPPPDPPPAAPPPPAPAAADEVVEKAKQEAYVARRVAELSRAGLWAERRLPRVMEPPRPKTHWDYLLEEMAWLAQDFAHERKWKKQAAKKCARAVQKYFQDKAVAAQKAEKAQELQLKKIAAFAAKEIRTFWTNVEKLVEWKRVRRVERARKEALDEQLSYIVDRTEKYSRQLAANLHAPRGQAASDDEFEPREGSSDDEATIAAAEREAPLSSPARRAELRALRRESRLDLTTLLPPGYRPHSPPLSDYGPDDEDSADDEDTIAEQETKERPEDTAEELAALRDEAQLGIDELVRRYAAEGGGRGEAARGDDGSDTGDDTDANDGETTDDEGDDSDDDDSDEEEQPLEALVAHGREGDGEESGERRVEACASVAAALQPTGTTLADTAVGTPVPRLLRHRLREYQHVGLHWLATMHARRLNGILADEMGLGKTIQTIALLAHLALERHDWGPHLVVAPTSVVLNWEMEFKKWCPAFKILTYYGTIKERKLKRVGWTKANSFHVCITSYKLVVQDHQSFRRKRWKYLILDEAQNIKNFKSQRWQMLLNFQTERRLLLTGTPLQNSLLELWSLMHFLMPAVFASHSHFREWFGEVAAAAEGAARNDALVRRLHEVLRPFLLRRLKADVERQMPRKFEHVLLCRLSKRQRFLYDDFMARAKTKESLASGNLLSVINVLMQLRKVCNHPDLFEPRPVVSPLQMPPILITAPAEALIAEIAERTALAARIGGDLATLEASGAGAFAAHRARHLAPPRRLIEELQPTPPPPRPPHTRLRLHLRLVPRAPHAAATPAPPPPLPPLRPSTARDKSSAAAPSPASRSQMRLEARRAACMRRLAAANERRCWRLPLFGSDLRSAVSAAAAPLPHRTIEDVLRDMHDLIDRFSVCWCAARAAAAQLAVGTGGGARAWRRRAARVDHAAAPVARDALALLHAPAARQAVAFPHPRLLQYDCGKLQRLASLLRRLKSGGHRVLIFTQMTRVLDVLEAFLSMHGHTYLRLDGATRVDCRQALVERFNADARVFAMILSTRSGGVGLNLTGADCVIFYDSDWNPTMDAQAQDRAHRIGQTRDVHVFRLVTAATVEENILRKADQKRRLGHLAIEDGNFTTSYLRQANIKELFGDEASAAASESSDAQAQGCELESALAACEDEADAAAARAARAEQRCDEAEFDETMPIDDDRHHAHADDADPTAAATAAAAAPQQHADELAALMKQLTPIEKYAMRVVESSEAATAMEQAAIDDMRRQLRDWEDKRRRLRAEPETRDEPSPRAPRAASPPLTMGRGDAVAQVWSSAGGERMPLWGPPTPPAGDGDVYCDTWARPLYRAGAAPEHALPPVHRREPRPKDARRRAHARAAPAPPSLFERAGPRPRPRPRAAHPHPHPAHAPPAPDWSPAEDAALRRALRLQRLPADAPAALAPNWDWVAELVNEVARSYRSPRQARDRHEALSDPERARRKHKKPSARRRPDEEAPRPPLARLEAMRDAAERRRAQPKRRLDDQQLHNPKHAALLADHGVDYEAPPTPMEVATRRAERIAKEKLKASAPPPQPPAAGAPPAAPAPQRIVVAAHAPPPSQPPGVSAARAAPSPSAALYRQPPLATRHHLKILHHAPQPQASHPQQTGGGEPSGGGGALRTLQLQQLALRRAAPASGASAATSAGPRLVAPASAASAATSAGPRLVARAPAAHVVVAHLAPAPPAPPNDPHRDDRIH